MKKHVHALTAICLGLSIFAGGSNVFADEVQSKQEVAIPEKKVAMGLLVESNIEGKHYELLTEKKVYILTGDTSSLVALKGKYVEVTGYLQNEKMNIYMRGSLLKVVSAVEVPEKDGLIKLPEGDDPKGEPIVISPIEKPSVKPIKKPIKKPVIKPIKKPVIKPIKKPIKKPIGKPIPKPKPIENPKLMKKPSLKLKR